MEEKMICAPCEKLAHNYGENYQLAARFGGSPRCGVRAKSDIRLVEETMERVILAVSPHSMVVALASTHEDPILACLQSDDVRKKLCLLTPQEPHVQG